MKITEINDLDVKCISWNAIAIGALVALGISFLLNLFSVAIGLSVVKSSPEGMTTLAVGGYVALLFSFICAMFISGGVAGYLGKCRHGGNVGSHIGVLYGFSAWCLALILGVLLASSFTRYAENFSNYVNHPAGQMTSSLNRDNASPERTVTAQKAQKLGISAMVVFSLFFVGALSSCLGGYFGMACDEYCCSSSKRKYK